MRNGFIRCSGRTANSSLFFQNFSYGQETFNKKLDKTPFLGYKFISYFDYSGVLVGNFASTVGKFTLKSGMVKPAVGKIIPKSGKVDSAVGKFTLKSGMVDSVVGKITLKSGMVDSTVGKSNMSIGNGIPKWGKTAPKIIKKETE